MTLSERIEAIVKQSREQIKRRQGTILPHEYKSHLIVWGKNGGVIQTRMIYNKEFKDIIDLFHLANSTKQIEDDIDIIQIIELGKVVVQRFPW